MPALSEEFVLSLARIGADIPDFKWYLSAIVFLGAANYPEHIPYLYQQLLQHHIHEEEYFEATKALREAFTKASAIMGAARVTSSPSQSLDVALLTPPLHHSQSNLTFSIDRQCHPPPRYCHTIPPKRHHLPPLRSHRRQRHHTPWQGATHQDLRAERALRRLTHRRCLA